MKIAIFHNVPFGGAQRTVLEYARRLSQRHEIRLHGFRLNPRKFDAYGCQPTSCSLQPGTFAVSEQLYADPRMSFPPVHNERFKLVFRLLDLVALEKAYRRVATNIERTEPDVVYVNPCRLTQAPLLIRHLRTPTVYYCAEPFRLIYDPRRRRASTAPLALKGALRRLLLLPLERADRRNLLAAHRVLTHSVFTAQQIREWYGIDPVLQYLGVNTDVYRPLNLERSNQVVCVSAVSPDKGQAFIVEALATIPRQIRPSITFAYTRADHSYIEQLRDKARTLQVEATFAKGLSDDEVVRLYNSSRLSLYAPFNEPFGLVPLEAMACGTPTVGVQEGGLLETIRSSRNGLLVDRDPEAFGAAISKVLQSNRLWQELSSNGIGEVGSRWSWEESARRLEEHLREVSGDGQRSPSGSTPSSPPSPCR